MAAAAIPLIISAVSPYIPTVVHLLEGVFGAKTGATKMSTATQILDTIAKAMATGGKVPGAPPTDTSYLQGAVEQVVQQLKSQGQLTGQSASVGIPANGWNVVFTGTIKQG